MKRWAPLVLAALGWGCSASRLMPGPQKGGYAVEVEAAPPAEARRRAVERFFDLYLSTEAQRAQAQALEANLLSKADSFIVRQKEEGTRSRFLVAYTRIGRELDRMGLIRPDGVKGRPKVAVYLAESGEGSGEESRAAEALRRQLLGRGYAVLDLGDSSSGARLRRGASAEDALAAAKRAGADVIVTGTAGARPLDDKRLDGFANFKAKIGLRAQTSALKEVAAFDLEAAAVDVEPAAAGAKALASAGELAGTRLEKLLAALYQQRGEFSLVVLNIGGLDRTRQLLEAVRGLEPVAAAALDTAAGKDVKLRLFADRMSADELTAELLRLREFNFNVRSVEPDFNYIELSSGEIF